MFWSTQHLPWEAQEIMVVIIKDEYVFSSQLEHELFEYKDAYL